MKGIGTHSDLKVREELVQSNLWLQDHRPLNEALRSANMDLTDAYVINWIPEQAEDVYVILVSDQEVLIVDLPRGEGQIRLERRELNVYMKRCSKILRRKIAIAQEMYVSLKAVRLQRS